MQPPRYYWEELEECKPRLVEAVRAEYRGYNIRMSYGWSLSIPTDICKVDPAIGEEVILIAHQGESISNTIHGIKIGGRVYRMPPVEVFSSYEPNRLEGAL